MANYKEKPFSNDNGTANSNGDNISVTIKTHHDKKGGHPHIIIEDIDDKHVSASPSQSKDDESIILLSINEIINHRISIQ